jgi:hypothetical protein
MMPRTYEYSMTTRAPHLLAIDRLSLLGNRSYRNPFLAAACEQFLAPLGIQAGYFEVSVSECARGSWAPFCAHNPKWSANNVDPRREFLRPLVAGAGQAEVTLTTELQVEIVPYPSARDQPGMAELQAALASGLGARFQAEIDEAKEHLVNFLGATFSTLSDPQTPVELHRLFMENPAGFVLNFLQRIAIMQSSLKAAIEG